MRNIVLIGMPGCGKSTVGVVLAKSLGMKVAQPLGDVLARQAEVDDRADAFEVRHGFRAVDDAAARGVTIKPGWTLRDLYNERCPLYEQYADIVQDCDGLRLRDVVAELQKKLKG